MKHNRSCKLSQCNKLQCMYTLTYSVENVKYNIFFWQARLPEEGVEIDDRYGNRSSDKW